MIAAHYAVFDHDNLRIAGNPAARGVYVSYRVGDAVYWTRGRVHLAAAEDLITDGENQARARCGNRVSDTPRGPLAAFQPRDAALDESEGMLVAEAPPESPPTGSMLVPELFLPLALLPLAGAGPAPPGPDVEPNLIPLIPFVPPGGGTLAPEWPPLPPGSGEPETPQDSPEPETGLLAAAGVLAVAGLAVWRMRRGRAA